MDKITLNLHSKFIISLTTLVALSLISMGYVLLRDADKRLDKFQYLQAYSQARTLAESSQAALLEEDFSLIEDLVKVAISEEYYDYAAIIDPSGMVIGHTDLDKVGTIVLQEKLLHPKKISFRDIVINEIEVREISYPIIVEGQFLATAQVAYYLHMRVASAKGTVAWIVNILIFMLVSMTLGSLFITNRLTRPILNLTNIVNENFSGDRLNIKDDILNRSDEVGSLARAFNNMSDQLVERLEELQHQISERELATEKNKTKSTFLANVSHELRTPLNAIIGYSELLSELFEQNRQTEYKPDIDNITYSAKHLNSLINDMLDLSKIEAGKISIEYQYFSIKDLVNEVEATTAPLMTKNKNKLITNYALQHDLLESDPLRLKQVLINLVSNAAKFTNDGEIIFDIIISEDVTKFIISDSGIGMSENQLEIVFDPFTQASVNTAKNFGGTGLGLTISRRICQLLHGDIGVTSQTGKGSTFTVELPLRSADRY